MFEPTGVVLLDREAGNVVFHVSDGVGPDQAWAVTFEAIRDHNPDWKEMWTAFKSAEAEVLALANRKHADGALESDGTVLLRTMKAIA